MIKASETVYISGPMTGLENFNRDNFKRIECYLKQAYQCNVFNPASLADGLPYEDYMRQDIAAVVQADVIVMLRNWENSRGAKVEYQVAAACGLRIIHEHYLLAKEKA